MPDDLRITPSDAWTRIADGRAIPLDVVAPGAWSQLDRAIQGAVRIPPDQLEKQAGRLPRNKEIIAYCT